MTVTIFGVLVALIGGYLLVGASALAMLIFVMFTTVMGGSAALLLPTGSSVLPSIGAVLLLALRCVLPSRRPGAVVRQALDAHLPLMLFTAYGVVGAVLLPFLFAGVLDVAPLRPVPSPDPFATVPLSFTSQNLTSAGYLFTTMLGSVCAFIAVQAADAEKKIVRAAAFIALFHAAVGYAGILAAGTPFAAAFDFFRNATYNQVKQDIGGFARMNGIMAEPSSYAGYGLIYFVFNMELWLSGIERRWTGPAALLLFTALVVSTSSTAYVGLTGYAAILLLRQIFASRTINASKLLVIAGGMLFAVVVLLLLVATRPDSLRLVETVYRSMILDKAESESALVRGMWAKQGIAAFWASAGLGVGAGSFRSSSLATAILGSMGVIGLLTYAAHLLRVIQPLRRSTYVRSGEPRVDVGTAAAWTIVAMTVPAFVAAPSPDPGLNWGLLSGIALALRKRGGRGPTAHSVPIGTPATR